MTSVEHSRTSQPPRWGLAAVGLLGLAVAAVLAAYAQISPGDGAAITTLGFTALLAMKSWLTTAAVVLVIVQVATALAMWGKLPGVSGSPAWAGPVHRWSGTAAFLLTLPVGFQCVWSLGWSNLDFRNLSHSVLGCLFYGVFAAKMLALRVRGLPGWALPVLGWAAGGGAGRAVVRLRVVVLHAAGGTAAMSAPRHPDDDASSSQGSAAGSEPPAAPPDVDPGETTVIKRPTSFEEAIADFDAERTDPSLPADAADSRPASRRPRSRVPRSRG